MSALAVVITDEQDSIDPDAQSKSTRFARFVASIVGSALLVAFAGCVAQPKHTACAADIATQHRAPNLTICVVKKGGVK